MKRKTVPDNFWDLRKLENGTIVYDVVHENGFRLLTLRGPGGWCNYIGVPLNSPLANIDYESELLESFPCHGGLTYAGVGDDVNRPAGWWYFGWDYAHAGDWSPVFEESGLPHYVGVSEKKWKFSEVREDSEDGYKQLKKICERLPKAEIPKEVKSFPPVLRTRKRLIRVCDENLT